MQVVSEEFVSGFLNIREYVATAAYVLKWVWGVVTVLSSAFSLFSSFQLKSAKLSAFVWGITTGVVLTLGVMTLGTIGLANALEGLRL